MPTNPIDLSGKTFGRWTVLHYVGKAYWQCRCECGTEKQVDGTSLRRGDSESCGCLRLELQSQRAKTHGMKQSREWQAWRSMKQRCLNPKHKAYENYGGRGIRVCDQWLKSFEAFFADMGHRPDGHTLERIDNDGNYEPGNCRWAPRIEQEWNKRTNRLVSIDGKRMPMAVAARKHGLTRGQLYDRLSYGWSLERALTTPIRSRKTRKAV
jgi:hypothetical protein